MNNKFLLEQRKKSFREVFAVIKKTFPFSSKEEFKIFYNAYNKYSKEISNLVEDDRNFFLSIERFLASLKNSHTKLGSYPGKIFFKPLKYSVVLVDKKFYLQNHLGNLIGEILSIDEKRPIDILNFHISRISSSTKQYSNYRALLFLLTDQIEKPILLKIRKINGEMRRFILPRKIIVYKPWKNTIEAKIINKNIGYLKIRAWHGEGAGDLIDKKIKYFIRNKVKSLIIDIRGNEGGDSRIAKHLASHFFNKKVLFSIVEERMSENNFKLKKRAAYIEPLDPYLDLPIILLIDEVCFSSNEYFIAGMKDNRRVLLIGRTTGGGSGNPKKFIIPYGDQSFELLVSTWNYFRPNSKPLEGKGIKPHISIKQNLDDLIKKRDKTLEVAIKEAKDNIRD